MDRMTHVLEAFDLYRFYHAAEEETLALRGVSLALHAGETVAVVGPSGSGKSTLLACLSGLDEPDGGWVELLGHRLTRRSEPERAAQRATHLGILRQSGNLFPQFTVTENIRLAMCLARKVDPRRPETLLAAVGLTHRREARPAQLSGGEIARAGLAVALASTPAILLADEPTGDVDAATEAEITQLIAAYTANGGAALLITHSAALARHADRIIYLQDGRITHE